MTIGDYSIVVYDKENDNLIEEKEISQSRLYDIISNNDRRNIWYIVKTIRWVNNKPFDCELSLINYALSATQIITWFNNHSIIIGGVIVALNQYLFDFDIDIIKIFNNKCDKPYTLRESKRDVVKTNQQNKNQQNKNQQNKKQQNKKQKNKNNVVQKLRKTVKDNKDK